MVKNPFYRELRIERRDRRIESSDWRIERDRIGPYYKINGAGDLPAPVT